jgi:hypothetical protein
MDLQSLPKPLLDSMRKELLSKYQDDAAKVFSSIKESHPDKNLFDYQIELLILLSNIPTTPIFKDMVFKEIVRLIDTEIHLGLLSEQKESIVSEGPSKGVGEEKLSSL